jgi:hypothetical protein
MHPHPDTLLAANDAAPLFPDVSKMTDEEFGNYEPAPERLAFYRLDTDEALRAFLHDVYWIGYPGLFVAVNHVWNMLEEPRAYRCTLMGQHSGAGGAGKTALVNTLRQFIGKALATLKPIPKLAQFDSMEEWNEQIAADRITEVAALNEVIDRYALVLEGKSP